MSIKAVLFDAYGTLFDVYSVGALAEELYPGQGAALAQLWRDKQLEYSRLRTISAQYRPFSQITADALRFAIAALGLLGPPDAANRLLAQYGRLELFAENRDALDRLSRIGLPLAILSNGDASMLAEVVSHARLDGVFRYVLSADSVQRFKTAPEVYRLGVDAFGAPASELLFVSSNGWDACGASWYGYCTFWINRFGQPAEELGVAAAATGRSMNDVVDFVQWHQTS